MYTAHKFVSLLQLTCRIDHALRFFFLNDCEILLDRLQVEVWLADAIVPAEIEIVVEGDSNTGTVAATEAMSVYYVPLVPREQEIQEIEEIEEIHEIQEVGKIRPAGLEKIDEIEEIEEGQGSGAYRGHDYSGYRGHTYAPRPMIRNSYSTWTRCVNSLVRVLWTAAMYST